MKDDRLSEVIKGWLVVCTGALFYLYQFILRVSPNIMHNELLDLFVIDAGTLGTVIGAYYWAYTLMQLPLGMTMDRIGPRYFLCGAAFLCAISCYIFGNTHSAYAAAGARFLMGMGSACGLVGTLKLGTLWIKPKDIAKVTSFTILMGTAGAGLGGAPLRYVLVRFGLEATMEMLAILGVVIGLVVYLSVRIHPPINGQPRGETANTSHPLRDLLVVIREKQAWVVALYGMLMYAPITIIGIAWGAPFLKRYYNTSETLAVSVVSTMFLGAAIGSPLAAFISDLLLKKRRIPMIFGAAMSAIIWSTILFVEKIPFGVMYALFFSGGVAYTFKTLSFASICDVMPRTLSGTSIAFVNMVVMTTGIIFHPLIGNLIDYHSAGTVVDHAYTLADYRFALCIIPICAFCALGLTIFMRESHPLANHVDDFGALVDKERL